MKMDIDTTNVINIHHNYC